MRIHISLGVTDLAASTRFYTDLFGEGPDKERADYARFAPADVPVVLTLNQGGSGIDHLGLRHREPAAARAAWERLSDRREQEAVTCCYAVQDKAWVTDPDGHAWEVYALLDDDAPRQAATACCA